MDIQSQRGSALLNILIIIPLLTALSITGLTYAQRSQKHAELRQNKTGLIDRAAIVRMLLSNSDQCKNNILIENPLPLDPSLSLNIGTEIPVSLRNAALGGARRNSITPTSPFFNNENLKSGDIIDQRIYNTRLRITGTYGGSPVIRNTRYYISNIVIESREVDQNTQGVASIEQIPILIQIDLATRSIAQCSTKPVYLKNLGVLNLNNGNTVAGGTKAAMDCLDRGGFTQQLINSTDPNNIIQSTICTIPNYDPGWGSRVPLRPSYSGATWAPNAGGIL